MGLQVNYIDKTGVELNYWNVKEVDLSVDDMVNSLNIVLRGYPTFETRKTFEAVRELKLNFTNAKTILGYPANCIYSAIYDLVKTLPEFSSATDIIE